MHQDIRLRLHQQHSDPGGVRKQLGCARNAMPRLRLLSFVICQRTVFTIAEPARTAKCERLRSGTGTMYAGANGLESLETRLGSRTEATVRVAPAFMLSTAAERVKGGVHKY